MVDGEDFVRDLNDGNPLTWRFDIAGLLMAIVSGFVLAVQTGVVGFVNVFSDVIGTYYGGATSFLVDLIDVIFPTSAFRIANNAAIQMIQGTGIFGFALGAIAVALTMYVVSEVVL